MTTPEYIAVAGVFATTLGVLVTWLVMKRQFASKKLTYSFEISPLLTNADSDLARDLKVTFRDEELHQPTLLSLAISNTGMSAIENAEVVVQLPGSTYLIPGYFVDVPPGYDSLWSIDRTDAEECTIKFKHINPKQVAHIRLLMDEVPVGQLSVACPMPNVECVQGDPVSLNTLVEILVSVVAPQLLRGFRV
jgi:hypothetical protein